MSSERATVPTGSPRTAAAECRTTTTPAVGASVDRLRLAVTSCQNFPAGHFVGYRHIVASGLDLVVHLGDYIYEGDSAGNPAVNRPHVPLREMLLHKNQRGYLLVDVTPERWLAVVRVSDTVLRPGARLYT
ncbi:MAG: alkaline phosphatase D family protein, partial [Actinomycetota bacterium]|nr:alkaline phosphatase D family protein [Actinomycetota bacterium]